MNLFTKTHHLKHESGPAVIICSHLIKVEYTKMKAISCPRLLLKAVMLRRTVCGMNRCFSFFLYSMEKSVLGLNLSGSRIDSSQAQMY
jgi:hypothetical protein